MGLEERRKIKELQDVTLPGRVQEIEEICGKAIPYEIDWDTLKDDAEGLRMWSDGEIKRVLLEKL